MKYGPTTLGAAENESGSAKHENGTRRLRYRRKRDLLPSIPPKMSLREQNLKMGADALRTTENESGRAKLENGTHRTRYSRKRAQVRKT
jgi:hypothetical protein